MKSRFGILGIAAAALLVLLAAGQIVYTAEQSRADLLRLARQQAQDGAALGSCSLQGLLRSADCVLASLAEHVSRGTTSTQELQGLFARPAAQAGLDALLMADAQGNETTLYENGGARLQPGFLAALRTRLKQGGDETAVLGLSQAESGVPGLLVARLAPGPAGSRTLTAALFGQKRLGVALSGLSLDNVRVAALYTSGLRLLAASPDEPAAGGNGQAPVLDEEEQALLRGKGFLSAVTASGVVAAARIPNSDLLVAVVLDKKALLSTWFADTLRDAGGEFLLLLAALVLAVGAILSRRRLHQAARQEEESRRRTRAFLENSPYPIVRFMLDGTISEINPAALNAFGGSQEAVRAAIGKEVAEIAAHLSSEERVNFERTIETSGGTPFPAELHAWRNTADDGESHGIVVIRDITARKEEESQTLRAKRRLELVIEGAGLGYWDWNVATGEVLYSDQWQRLLGYEPGEVPPAVDFFAEMLHPDDRERVLEVNRRHMVLNSSSFAVEFRMRTKTGGYVWILGSGRAVEWDEEGRPLRAAGIHMGIGERKRLEQVREDVERMIRHDLRTPLGNSVSVAQALAMMGGLSEEQQRLVELLKESGKRAMRIISLSLDLHRMEQGEYELLRAPCDLLAVFGSIRREQAALLSAKSAAIEVLVDGRPPREGESFEVQGECDLLQCLFDNLVKNALEAMPAGTSLRVALHFENGTARIKLHNQGTVPKDVRANFFEKYSTSGKPGGTGIGTYIARLVARTHGGDVAFTTSETEGTTLHVILPRA
ncbi:PAS/PAC sensor signal transduction histidine kinase [Desulfovibrio sp. X2]|uniref:PAS domain-containing protein n=1 Tax=Desulfovibrio sp. X2 TaxID=941449 RepID=UPI000358D454|nr:PAS domain-containing protein [Desulfovibrio sp. X2]EPR44673.1 PAS/PAC sensor signal transduction histidine kinase [Desulfovibrio sp. X2]